MTELRITRPPIEFSVGAKGKVELQAGMRFGRLVVVAQGRYFGKHAGWTCRCDCGTFVDRRGTALRLGHVQSCGCLAREVASRTRTRHGLAGTREHRAWVAIRQRCRDPHVKEYPRYGGRGIKVAERWANFEAFLADMGQCPPGMSIERIDNDGNYEPGNCRWATQREQARNTSATHWLEFNDRRAPMVAWSEELGIPYSALQQRLRAGWSTERALTTPLRGSRA